MFVFFLWGIQMGESYMFATISNQTWTNVLLTLLEFSFYLWTCSDGPRSGSGLIVLGSLSGWVSRLKRFIHARWVRVWVSWVPLWIGSKMLGPGCPPLSREVDDVPSCGFDVNMCAWFYRSYHAINAHCHILLGFLHTSDFQVFISWLSWKGKSTFNTLTRHIMVIIKWSEWGTVFPVEFDNVIFPILYTSHQVLTTFLRPLS